MRWTKKYKRYVKRFAILPIKIRGETRWLETVYLEQKRDDYAGPFAKWKNRDFVSKDVYENHGEPVDVHTLSEEASKLYKELKEAIWNGR